MDQASSGVDGRRAAQSVMEALCRFMIARGPKFATPEARARATEELRREIGRLTPAQRDAYQFFLQEESCHATVDIDRMMSGEIPPYDYLDLVIRKIAKTLGLMPAEIDQQHCRPLRRNDKPDRPERMHPDDRRFLLAVASGKCSSTELAVELGLAKLRVDTVAHMARRLKRWGLLVDRPSPFALSPEGKCWARKLTKLDRT